MTIEIISYFPANPSNDITGYGITLFAAFISAALAALFTIYLQEFINYHRQFNNLIKEIEKNFGECEHKIGLCDKQIELLKEDPNQVTNIHGSFQSLAYKAMFSSGYITRIPHDLQINIEEFYDEIDSIKHYMHYEDEYTISLFRGISSSHLDSSYIDNSVNIKIFLYKQIKKHALAYKTKVQQKISNLQDMNNTGWYRFARIIGKFQ